MGFVCEYRKDIWYFHVVDGGRTGIRTKMSHGEEEVGENLLHKMARQLRLTRRELDCFVDGTLTQAEYITKLRTKGAIR